MANMQVKRHYMKAQAHKGGQGQRPKNLEELGPHLVGQVLDAGVKMSAHIVLLNFSTGRDHTNDYYPGLTDSDMRDVVRGLHEGVIS